MKSIMNYKFSQVPEVNIPRSTFNRSHSYKTTFDADYLIPFFVDEALPGDTMSMKETIFARLNTPLVPIMDNMTLDVYTFSVPYRIIHTNFKKLCGEQVDPGDSIDYSFPTVTSHATNGWVSQSLGDYFGIPTYIASLEVNSLAFRAYNSIWNTWFRDQNLQDSVVVDLDDGPDTETDYVLLKANKRHDYFTSSLPWPVKDDAEVSLPLGSQADIKGIGKETTVWQSSSQAVYESGGSASVTYTDFQMIDPSNNDKQFYIEKNSSDSYPKIYADLSNATASTVNDLREAFQIQKLLEKDARGGTRYQEILRNHFGVVGADSRVQIPELLYIGRSNVSIHQVPQTSETGTTPQGNMSAYGMINHYGTGWSKSFTEHCIVMSLMVVRGDQTYQKGLPRMFSRSTRYDMYWPSLCHLGEQSILNKEIFCQGNSTDDQVFSYQERWAEYRYYPSKITGKLRSVDPGNLDVWHLSEAFGSLPTLSSSFIESNLGDPLDRTVATPSEPHFTCDVYNSFKHTRCMPVYSVPGMIDRF